MLGLRVGWALALDRLHCPALAQRPHLSSPRLMEARALECMQVDTYVCARGGSGRVAVAVGEGGTGAAGQAPHCDLRRFDCRCSTSAAGGAASHTIDAHIVGIALTHSRAIRYWHCCSWHCIGSHNSQTRSPSRSAASPRHAAQPHAFPRCCCDRQRVHRRAARTVRPRDHASSGRQTLTPALA
jgi:hypothetical protein